MANRPKFNAGQGWWTGKENGQKLVNTPSQPEDLHLRNRGQSYKNIEVPSETIDDTWSWTEEDFANINRVSESKLFLQDSDELDNEVEDEPTPEQWNFSGTFENVIFNIKSSVTDGTQQINAGVLTQEDREDLLNTVHDLQSTLKQFQYQKKAEVQEIAQATAHFVYETLQHQNMKVNFDRLDQAADKIPASKPFIYRLAAKLMSRVCPG